MRFLLRERNLVFPLVGIYFASVRGCEADAHEGDLPVEIIFFYNTRNCMYVRVERSAIF